MLHLFIIKCLGTWINQLMKLTYSSWRHYSSSFFFSSPFFSVHLYVLCLPRLWCVLFSGGNRQLRVSSAFQCDSCHGPSQSPTGLLCSGKWRGCEWQSATSCAAPLRKWGGLSHSLIVILPYNLLKEQFTKKKSSVIIYPPSYRSKLIWLSCL